MTDHLISNKLLNSSQHGFMRNKSCLTNLLEFFEIVTSEVDDNNPMDIIYLDFSKAFDKVPKMRLLEKIKAHNIHGDILKWIESWLTGRRQRVVLNGSASSWSPVESGVPQGSVLGPLAFVIFINDLDLCAQLIRILKKFADDTKVGHIVRTDEERNELQTCLDLLCDWADTWGMSFNTDKCKVLHVGHNNPQYSYTMNGYTLSEPGWEQDIGVKVKENLKPSLQCSSASKRANFVLGQISRAFHFRDRHVFLRLYKTYVRCHLEFAVSAWSPWTERDKYALEKVQRRAVRMITGLKGKNYEEKLKELGMLSLEDRRIRYDMVQVFKILYKFDDVDSRVWFQTMENSARDTRLSSYPLNLTTTRSRLEIRQHFFSQRVVNLWNDLPVHVKDSRNPKIFKQRFDEWKIIEANNTEV